MFYTFGNVFSVVFQFEIFLNACRINSYHRYEKAWKTARITINYNVIMYNSALSEDTHCPFVLLSSVVHVVILESVLIDNDMI